MSEPSPRPLSLPWVAISFVVFMAVEVALGWVVGELLLGGFTSHVFRLRVEVMLSLGSFLVGGLIVGFVSPGLRLIEPAIAAALAVASTFVIGWLTPVTFYGFHTDRVLWGGAVAFVLALLGAHWGEQLSGNEA